LFFDKICHKPKITLLANSVDYMWKDSQLMYNLKLSNKPFDKYSSDKFKLVT